MIYNFFRICLFATAFTLMWMLFRGSHISQHSIDDAKQQLGIYEIGDQDAWAIQIPHTHTPELLSAPTFSFYYSPETLEISQLPFTNSLRSILSSQAFKEKLTPLDVYLYGPAADVRGQMKAAAIHLHGLEHIENDELTSVFIHELAHHIDIYTLKKKVFQDPSHWFYSISWKDTNTILAGQKLKDFVSGYSMSNKYEDFAESLTYYVFANEEMRQKANNSFAIKQKYDFFQTYMFKDQVFQGTDFSLEDAKKYYWDVTKKEYDIQNFLEYLEKSI